MNITVLQMHYIIFLPNAIKIGQILTLYPHKQESTFYADTVDKLRRRQWLSLLNVLFQKGWGSESNRQVANPGSQFNVTPNS